MEVVVLTGRIILALVFSVAGIAKMADFAGSRRALTNFGVSEWMSAPLARSLPVVEIMVALALIPVNSAWWGAIAAAVLLLIFTAGIGVNLARGNSPDCHCFGQLHSKPVSWSVFARNLALAALAAFVVAQGKDQPGLATLGWLDDLRSGEVLSLILSAFAAGMLVTTIIYLRKVLGQQTVFSEKIDAIKKVIDEDYAEPEPVEREDAVPPREGLPVGAPAPEFSLSAAAGNLISLDDLLGHGKPVVLLFVSPSCSPCESLLPMVKVWERDFGEHLTIALLSKGTPKENRTKMAKYGARYLLLLAASDVAEDYQANWTPAAVLIDSEGKIASLVSSGAEAIRALINHTVTTGAGRAAGFGSSGIIPRINVGDSLFKIGEPAPRFSLANVDGKEVGFENLLGTATLLLFWDPQCPFCRAMAEDIKGWEADPPIGAPKLVFVASGNVENLREDFRSPILLDPDFDIGPLFGSRTTPSAVLIDSDGRIASSLAKGARSILALAGVRRKELPLAPSFGSATQENAPV